MTKRDYLRQAIKLEYAFSTLQHQNSPTGQYYMVPVDPAFMMNANSRDLDELSNTLNHNCHIVRLKPIYGIPGYCACSKEPYRFEQLTNGNTILFLIRRSGNIALLMRLLSPGSAEGAPRFIIAYNFSQLKGTCSWGQGHYRYTIEDAIEAFLDMTLNNEFVPY